MPLEVLSVICPYTALHARTRSSLDRCSHRTVYVGMRGDTAYWGLLRGLWRRGEAFCLVEHDIELHPGVLPELEACPEAWCSFPFSRLMPGPHSTWDGQGWSEGIPLLTKSLGCVRWSADLMAAEPDLMESVGKVERGGLCPGHWRRLDDVIAQVLEGRGYQVHVHHPAVAHHHWLERWERCSCGDPACRPDVAA